LSAVAHIDEYKTGTFNSDEFRGEMSWNGWESNNLLRNEGLGEDGVPRFSDVALAHGAIRAGDARGVAAADFDNDGDLDLAINHNPGDNDIVERRKAAFLRNRIGETRSWLAVELRGTRSNRDGVGAMVTVEAAGESQLRLRTAGSSFASQQSERLYFGLGEHSRVGRLTVRWPSGLVDEFTDLEARRLVRITEGEGVEILSLVGAAGAAAPGSTAEAP
jgi:hypothetical protein